MPKAKIVSETVNKKNSETALKEKVEEPKSEKNFQDQLEEWADGLVNSISYDRLKIWKNIFFHPTDTFTQQMKYASISRGAKDVFIVSLPSLLLGLIGLMIMIGILALYGSVFALLLLILSPIIGVLGIIGLVIGAIILLVLYIASPIISWFIYTAIQFILAKLLGGQADFKTHAYLTALAEAGNGWVASLFAILSFIPCVGWILRPIATLVSFYSIFLNFKAIQIAHGLDTPRAAAVVLIPIVIGIAMLIFLFLAFYLGIFSLVFLGPLIGAIASKP